MSGALVRLKMHAPPLVREAVCAVHGAFESRCFVGSVWSVCPQCVAEEEGRRGSDAHQEGRVRWQQALSRAGIPFRFQDRSLAAFRVQSPPQERALGFAQAYAEGFEAVLERGRCALFVGRPGTGKTHLAVGVGLEVIRAGHSVLFTTVMRALRRVKDSWGRERSGESESQAVAALVKPDLLILDEVGVQFGSETERMILFDVLNERYEGRRPTLLLSNLPVSEVRRFLGERVFDRLREDGGEVVTFDWGSWRGRRAASSPFHAEDTGGQ